MGFLHEQTKKGLVFRFEFNRFNIQRGGGESVSNACGIEEKFESVTLLGTCERRVMPSREIFFSRDKENLEDQDFVYEKVALGRV